jgi:hypothetical protein
MDAAWPAGSVTTGHPGGVGEAFTTHPAGAELTTTPEVIGFSFWSSNVIVGSPCRVQE